LVNDQWLAQTFAALAAVACLVTTAAVLQYHDGKPAPEYRWSITLNTIISILATIAKAAMMFTVSDCLGQLKWLWFQTWRSLLDMQTFDNASRGPLGASHIFLGRLGLTPAAFGAAITLAALAFDPFTQQLLTYPQVPVYVDSNLVSTKQDRFFLTNPTHDVIQTEQAIQLGLWTDNFDRIFTCPTGNCTFRAFESLNWCSQCQDEQTSSFLEPCSILFSQNDTWDDDGFAFRNCTLKSSIIGDETIQIKAIDSTFGGSINDIAVTIPTYQIKQISDIRKEAFAMVGGPVLSPMGSWVFLVFRVENWLLVVQSQTVCSIDFCLQNETLTVLNGQGHFNGSVPIYGDKDLRQLTSYDERTSVSFICWSPRNTTDRVTAPYEMTWNGFDSFVVNDTHFAFCGIALYGWWDWDNVISKLIVGEQTGVLDLGPFRWEDNFGVLADANETTILWGGGVSQNGSVALTVDHVQYPNTSTHGLLSAQFRGPESFIQNVAASLTKMGWNSVNATDIYGKLGTAPVSVRVRWPWLILPTVLTIMTVLFLVLTIHLTQRAQSPIWKSSTNAVLFHGLDADYDTNLQDVSEMNEQAADTMVRLAMLHRHGRIMLETSTKSFELKHPPNSSSSTVDDGKDD